MRTGPKGDAPNVKAAKGETRPSRAVVHLYPDHASRPDPDQINPPSWLSAKAKAIWKRKIERYRQRGQKVDGFQDSLAQYCSLEAELEKLYAAGMMPTMAAVTQHRMWAAEFYDTPASQKAPASGGGQDANPFARNGHRPRA